MSVIINPAAEKQARDAADARIMDEKNLARTLFTNSYFNKQTEGDGLSPTECFDLAQAFIKIQTKRFPKNDTFDGRSQG